VEARGSLVPASRPLLAAALVGTFSGHVDSLLSG
jgi:hypothetical protein